MNQRLKAILYGQMLCPKPRHRLVIEDWQAKMRGIFYHPFYLPPRSTSIFPLIVSMIGFFLSLLLILVNR